MPRDDPSATDAAAMDAEDVRLMARVKNGETAAFEELIERRQALVLGTVARMLGSNSEVEDIAQQVFVRVWKSAPRYVASAKFTTWLLKITRNLVFNEMRRRERHRAIPLQNDPESAPLQLPDERAATPEAALLERELRGAIEEAIQALPEMQRMAVILRRYEELSYEDIADVLDQTVPAVKSLLFRARSQLRERLRDYLEGE